MVAVKNGGNTEVVLTVTDGDDAVVDDVCVYDDNISSYYCTVLREYLLICDVLFEK